MLEALSSDINESAYHEHRRRRANIAVHSCAEPFPNDGSVSSSLLKALNGRGLEQNDHTQLSYNVDAELGVKSALPQLKNGRIARWSPNWAA